MTPQAISEGSHLCGGCPLEESKRHLVHTREETGVWRWHPRVAAGSTHTAGPGRPVRVSSSSSLGHWENLSLDRSRALVLGRAPWTEDAACPPRQSPGPAGWGHVPPARRNPESSRRRLPPRPRRGRSRAPAFPTAASFPGDAGQPGGGGSGRLSLTGLCGWPRPSGRPGAPGLPAPPRPPALLLAGGGGWCDPSAWNPPFPGASLASSPGCSCLVTPAGGRARVPLAARPHLFAGLSRAFPGTGARLSRLALQQDGQRPPRPRAGRSLAAASPECAAGPRAAGHKSEF